MQDNRYSRHLALKEFDQNSQEALLDSHIVIIGCGGIGSLAATILAANGVGEITLIDNDKISLTNLHRQIPYKLANIGKLKIDILKSHINELNPDIKVNQFAKKITDTNISEILDGFENIDLIIDGVDNFLTRFLIHEYGFKNKIAVLMAAVIKFKGQISLFTPFVKNNPCYRCLVPENPGDEQENCMQGGVLGSVASIISSLAANEAIKYIANIKGQKDLNNKLLCYNALNLEYKLLKINKNINCSLCSKT